MNREQIGKDYNEVYKLAKQFHTLYELLAPDFGYETREDTKEFDEHSKNGRLMMEVCRIIYLDKIKTY